MTIAIQIAGSLLVLAGFALAQWGAISVTSRSYLTLNTIGSGILAIEAAHGEQWGFLLLEGVWAIVSAIGLARALTRRSRPTPSS